VTESCVERGEWEESKDYTFVHEFGRDVSMFRVCGCVYVCTYACFDIQLHACEGMELWIDGCCLELHIACSFICKLATNSSGPSFFAFSQRGVSDTRRCKVHSSGMRVVSVGHAELVTARFVKGPKRS